MGQLVNIESDGWCCIGGPSRKLHYYTKNQGGIEFPTPACKRFRTSEDVYLATSKEMKISQFCQHCEKSLLSK